MQFTGGGEEEEQKENEKKDVNTRKIRNCYVLV